MCNKLYDAKSYFGFYAKKNIRIKLTERLRYRETPHVCTEGIFVFPKQRGKLMLKHHCLVMHARRLHLLKSCDVEEAFTLAKRERGKNILKNLIRFSSKRENFSILSHELKSFTCVQQNADNHLKFCKCFQKKATNI